MNSCSDLFATLQAEREQFVGKLIFRMNGISFNVSNKDVVGNVIQEWFGAYLLSKGLKISFPDNSQTWPDIKIDSFNCEVEVKSFNYTAGPSFDISNFAAYVSSLLINPHRLYDNHFIFGYSSVNGTITIEKIWLKKIWEITGPSETNITEMQVKRGMAYNLRPKRFYSDNVDVYASEKSFLINLSKAIDKFNVQIGCSGTAWLSQVNVKLGL